MHKTEINKTSIILYAVLSLAIIGSYCLHFTGKKKKEVVRAEFVGGGGSTEGIVYVDIDSLIFEFDMFQDRRDELFEKQRRAEAEFTSKGNAFERDARDYQDKVSKGLVTRATAEQMQQNLMRQEQELVNLRDKLSDDLMEEEAVMNRQIIDYITRFLEENRDVYGYSYVLGKSFGGVVLYGEPAFDITQQVLEGINTKYQAEKRRR